MANWQKAMMTKQAWHVLFPAPQLAAILCVAFLCECAAGTVFVKEGGTGDGSSWAQAAGDLQAAIESCAAAGGGEVWVAAGVYRPSSRPNGGSDSNARTVHFSLRNGVSVVCGFSGDATDGREDSDEATDVDPEANRVVLSGDVGAADTDTDGDGVPDEPGGDSGDNAYNVFLHPATAALNGSAGLDGAWVVGGRGENGPGMCNLGSSPSITRCAFVRNRGVCGGGMYNTASSPTLGECTFAANSASTLGGGLYNRNSSAPSLTNCVFSGNTASGYGGGVYNTGSSPTAVRCSFSGNVALDAGGGVHNVASSPVFRECAFSGNAAASSGGGMCNYNGCSPTLVSCQFLGNSADNGGGIQNYRSSPIAVNSVFAANTADYGGGMLNDISSGPVLANCVFSGNSATDGGGAMYSCGSALAVATGCAFVGNVASIGGALLNENASSPTLANCIAWDNQDGIVGGGRLGFSNNLTDSLDFADWPASNRSADPLFADATDPDGVDGVWGTADDGLRLLVGSPGVDAGDDTALPQGVDTDLAGADRVQGIAVDLGPYESSPISPGCRRVAFRIGDDGSSSVAASGVAGRFLVFEVTSGDTPPPVTVECSEGLHFVRWVSTLGTESFLNPLVLAEPAVDQTWTAIVARARPNAAGVAFVKPNGTGDGGSWAAATGDLQAAIESCAWNRGGEVWVAAGVYRPTSRPNGGDVGDPLTVHFSLRNGVSVFCGFPADAADGRADCDEAIDAVPAVNRVILSGDIGDADTDADGDGIPDQPGGDSADNVAHVFDHTAAAALNGTAELNGAWIVGGRASEGAGMRNVSCSPRVTNCVFRQNGANYGAGMFNLSSSSPTLVTCTFAGNAAAYGAGVYNDASSPILTDCILSGNSASYSGAGMCNANSSLPTLGGCVFSANRADRHGGGMYNDSSSPDLSDCVFSGNDAGYYGGGMYTGEGLSTTVIGCEFFGNSAGQNGGGVFNYRASIAFTGCSIRDNTASEHGGGIFNTTVSSPSFVACVVEGNSATTGGGVRNLACSPVFSDCVFSRNESSREGGGVYSYQSMPVFSDCAFVENSAGTVGGCIRNYSSSPQFANCVLFGNSADEDVGGMCSDDRSWPVVANCIIWDNAKGAVAGGDPELFTNNLVDVRDLSAWPTSNRYLDPLFVDASDPDGEDDLWGTADDGLHLQLVSPGVDAGDNEAVPAGDEVDLAGAPRIQWDTVDLGPYESSATNALLLCSPAGPGLAPGQTISWRTIHCTIPAEDALYVTAELTSNGQTVSLGEGGVEDAVAWDPAAIAPGWHVLRLALQRGANTSVLDAVTARVLVLEPDVLLHEGLCDGSEVWASDHVHVIQGVLTVPSGQTLTIADGSVVKFVDGASIVVEEGGELVADNVVFTHIADDSVGGDTNQDGTDSVPSHDSYSVSGTGTLSIGSDSELRYLTFERGGVLSASQTWSGGRCYRISETIGVPEGVTLTIMPGAILKFETGCSLIVEDGGALSAIGSRAQPIVFTSILDDESGGDTNGDGDATVATPGDWRGIIMLGVGTLRCVRAMYAAPDNETGILEVGSSGELHVESSVIAHARFDAVWNWGGALSAENSIIADVGLGAAPYRGTSSYTNCVFDDVSYICMYWSHWTGSASFGNCSFSRVSAGWMDLNGNPDPKPTFGHCAFWNPADLGPQNPGQVGSNGNIWGDPLFRDPDNGDFRLRPGSPLIDAGDGEVAPELDAVERPRVDDCYIPDTGTSGANGTVPDIGAYEFADGASSDVDLAVSWVQGPTQAMVGKEAEVRWRVTNVGTRTAVAPWQDTISFAAVDSSGAERLVTAAERLATTSLAPGASVEQACTVKIPSLEEGVWYCHVQTNAYRDVFEGMETGNNARSSEVPTSVTVDRVTVGTPFSLALSSAGSNCLVLEQAEGQPLTIVLSARDGKAASVQLVGGVGQVAHDPLLAALVGVPVGDQVLVDIPAGPCDRDIYLLLTLDTEAVAELTVEVTPTVFALLALGTSIHTSGGGVVALELFGTGFSDGMALGMDSAGHRHDIVATKVDTVNGNKAVAYLDFEAAAPGVYDTTLSVGTEESVLTESMTILEPGNGAVLDARLVIPDVVRDGRWYAGRLEYANTGDADMPAPIFEIEGTTGTLVGITSVDRGISEELDVVGISPTTPAGVLKAGEANTLDFVFLARAGCGISLGTYPNDDSPVAYRQWETWREYGDSISEAATRLNMRRRHGREYRLDVIRGFAKIQIAGLPCQAVCGTVVDAVSGSPVAGTTVWLEEPEFSLAVAAAVTSADGSFVIEGVEGGTQYSVHVSGNLVLSPGSVVVPPSDDVRGIQIWVKQACRVEGRVLDADGAPIPEVEVLVKDVDGVVVYHTGTLLREESSDPLYGAFAAGELPPGEYTVETGLGDGEYSERPSVDVVLTTGNDVTGVVLEFENVRIANTERSAVRYEGKPTHQTITRRAIDLFLSKNGANEDFSQFIEDLRAHKEMVIRYSNEEDFTPWWIASPVINGHLNPPVARSRAMDKWVDGIESYNPSGGEDVNCDLAFQNLGRVLHLLQDMHTPAHVHGDKHLPVNSDCYEDYCGDNDPEIRALANEETSGTFISPTAPSDSASLGAVFSSAVSYTSTYPSDDYAGTSDTKNRGFGYKDEEKRQEMREFYHAEFRRNNPIPPQDDPGELLKYAVREDCYVDSWMWRIDLTGVEWIAIDLIPRATRESARVIAMYAQQNEPEEEPLEPVPAPTPDVPLSCDPNEMAGPVGFGDPDTERFVLPGQWMEYTVYFENKSDAAAAAQEVWVTSSLSEYLDWSTLELGEVVFCNQTELGLKGKRSGSIEVGQIGTAYRVRVEFSLDQEAGVAAWYLRTVDPSTQDGWPTNAYAGFLPPNDDDPEDEGEEDDHTGAPHCGEGYLTYRIRLRDDVEAGTRVGNSATIVFDYNDPIETDPAWFNTVADNAPGTVALREPANGTIGVGRSTSLSWVGTDYATAYDIYVWPEGQEKPDTPTAEGLAALFLPANTSRGYDTAYQWQVTARNQFGASSSEVWVFTTVDEAPTRPDGEAPADGETEVAWTRSLDWGDCLRATAYDVYFWKASELKPEAATASGVGESHWTPQSRGVVLEPNTAYCWQVVAKSRDNQKLGPVWRFQTEENDPATFDLAGSYDSVGGWFAVTGSNWNDPEGAAECLRYEWRYNGVAVEGLDGSDVSLADVVGERGETGLVSCRVTAWDGWDEGQSTEWGWAFYQLETGWNVVALPLAVADARPEALFAAPDQRDPLYSGTVWSWDGDALRYQRAEALEPGRGYWLYVPSTERETGSVVVEGIVPDTSEFALGQHWRLVGFPPFLGGSSAEDIRATTGGEGMQEWRGGAYVLPSGMLEFLRGYWLYLQAPTVLTPVGR